ncbi:unnamed protein product [Rotaria socialis]|uniref:BHLH domain-containing protein n=2 Tax=Rotaria socialis TaxID=392032 RepID=A0A818NYJ1_9BILA|nr:unnamed protein product [Rotaria socialis]CAF3614452.1 unnamed protein product [Rotaria socialis]CAF4225546.1 unnamed protein product [Rotaria socialis]CAF4317960.1 unnamed protein product [Rotaria socialis]CAF4376424.1 unnamed protein product [Rotaria socialis]
MNNSSAIKLESIELDNNRIVVNTTDLPASMPHYNRMKRSRKAANPSKTIKTSRQTLFIDSLMNTFQIQTDASSPILMTSTDDELSNLPQFDRIDEQENNDETSIDMNEESSITHNSVSLKRPRLSYNKRLEANARERERVHNLTAAFEALRQVIPMYGDQSKLSRLSILRIACSYVHVLGALNEIDFSQGQNAYTLNESFHMLSCTILNELKRKKSN